MPTKKGKYVEIRRHRNPTYRMTAEPQKRGAKPHYTGSRLTFLEGYLDEYVSLRGKSRRKFWHELFEAWWQKYPWRLPETAEPPTNDLEKMRELSFVGADVDAKADTETRGREVRSFV